jgi:hypothetical protein
MTSTVLARAAGNVTPDEIPSLPPPTGCVQRLNPEWAAGLERLGYDSEDYRRRLNESNGYGPEREQLDGTVGDAIDGEVVYSSSTQSWWDDERNVVVVHYDITMKIDIGLADLFDSDADVTGTLQFPKADDA